MRSGARKYALVKSVPYADMKAAASEASILRTSTLQMVLKNYGFYASKFTSRLGDRGLFIYPEYASITKWLSVMVIIQRDLLRKDDGYYIRSLWKYDPKAVAMIERYVIESGMNDLARG